MYELNKMIFSSDNMKLNQQSDFEEKSITANEIGASLLDGLTTSLYEDAISVIREYVCNAIDAGAKNVNISWLGPNFTS